MGDWTVSVVISVLVLIGFAAAMGHACGSDSANTKISTLQQEIATMSVRRDVPVGSTVSCRYDDRKEISVCEVAVPAGERYRMLCEHHGVCYRRR